MIQPPRVLGAQRLDAGAIVEVPWWIDNLAGKRAFNTVVEKGDTTCVQWLVKHGSMHVFDYDCAFLIAVHNGRFGAVQLLHGLVASLDFAEQALEDKSLTGMSKAVESGRRSTAAHASSSSQC